MWKISSYNYPHDKLYLYYNVKVMYKVYIHYVHGVTVMQWHISNISISNFPAYCNKALHWAQNLHLIFFFSFHNKRNVLNGMWRGNSGWFDPQQYWLIGLNALKCMRSMQTDVILTVWNCLHVCNLLNLVILDTNQSLVLYSYHHFSGCDGIANFS